MVSTGEKHQSEIQEDAEPSASGNSYGYLNEIPLYISTSQRGLLSDRSQGNRILDKVKGLPRFMKFGSSDNLPSTSSKFQRISDEKQDAKHLSPALTKQNSAKQFFVPFVRKIDWASLWEMSKQWIRDPLNMALFVWITGVAISGAILFLVMTGMLNGALPKKSQRDAWFEVNNQILNALFTLMCLYQHPKRFYHLVLLCRWQPSDILKLRKIYCKNGTQKPNERKHMLVVVILLHINCFAQYALCGLNLGYPRSQRPAIGVGLCLCVAMGAAAIASVYNIRSPLGKDYDETEMDKEAQGEIAFNLNSPEKKYSFIAKEGRRTAVSSPEWIGGLFDFWDDVSLAYMSIFCSCCVFGWNMERLGFGNMYVHIATFLLFCLAPFFIFNLAALNINNENVREALGLSGFVLCVLGLLYGGFWRVQMRKRFKLPGSGFCCGKPAVTDFFQWLCCCWCSLAQEVRTADSYDVVDDKLYLKQEDDYSLPVLSPLPREDGSAMLKPSSREPYWARSSSSYFNSPGETSALGSKDKNLPVLKGGLSMGGEQDTMKTPVSPLMQREDDLLL